MEAPRPASQPPHQPTNELVRREEAKHLFGDQAKCMGRRFWRQNNSCMGKWRDTRWPLGKVVDGPVRVLLAVQPPKSVHKRGQKWRKNFSYERREQNALRRAILFSSTDRPNTALVCSATRRNTKNDFFLPKLVRHAANPSFRGAPQTSGPPYAIIRRRAPHAKLMSYGHLKVDHFSHRARRSYEFVWPPSPSLLSIRF